MSLVKILNQHCKNIDALIECTHRERDAIVYNRMNEMSDIAFSKSTLLRQAEELEAERRRLCEELTGTSFKNSASMDEAVGQLPSEFRHEIEALRETIRQKSNELQRETEINTVLMKDQLEYARFMLSILSNARQKDFYASNGAKRAPTEGAILNRKG